MLFACPLLFSVEGDFGLTPRYHPVSSVIGQTHLSHSKEKAIVMKKVLSFTSLPLLVLALLLLGACNQSNSDKDAEAKTDSATTTEQSTASETSSASLDTDTKKISYIFGLNMGRQFSSQDIDIDTGSFVAGINAAINDTPPTLSEEEIRDTMMAFQQQMQAKQQAQQQEMLAEKEAAASANKEVGAKFLEENAKKEGVVALSSGLQYEVIEEGTGAKPNATDTVTVHYRGTLIDGTEFDSSYTRGQPATFALNAVIPGWTEGLQLMPEGSKWKLYVPSDLGYGEGGTGGTIGPNATLVFDIELLQVGTDKDKPAADKTSEAPAKTE